MYSARNAEFLYNEVPGITIPDDIREKMKFVPNSEETGVTIAQEILEELRPVVQGVYMIPVFGRYDLIAYIMDAV